MRVSDVPCLAPYTQDVRPMRAGLQEEGVRHTQDKAGFRREFVDKKRVILVVDGKVRTEIIRKGYLDM
jgi:hypothetical protein